ncbi:hypothetical protein AB0K60_09350 [Thermopolyspora sp. NPDC052614]|uniref:hypothetical protein n=1 Tax=Thermopolyspora sp. NPDC052614 TaxID=3155682 RepID=UPI003435545C
MRRIDLNIIRVGVGDPADPIIQRALATTNDIFAQVNISLGQVKRFDVPAHHIAGMNVIRDKNEAFELTKKWTAPGRAIDVFVVSATADWMLGASPIGGTCQKYGCVFVSGVVMQLSEPSTGNVLAHEIGHYLGLDDDEYDKSNLMHYTVPNGKKLTQSQGRRMNTHCFLH